MFWGKSLKLLSFHPTNKSKWVQQQSSLQRSKPQLIKYSDPKTHVFLVKFKSRKKRTIEALGCVFSHVFTTSQLCLKTTMCLLLALFSPHHNFVWKPQCVFCWVCQNLCLALFEPSHCWRKGWTALQKRFFSAWRATMLHQPLGNYWKLQMAESTNRNKD